jgi:hypothetical protein
MGDEKYSTQERAEHRKRRLREKKKGAVLYISGEGKLCLRSWL